MLMARGTALSFAVLTARPIVQQTSLRRYASSLSPSSVAIPRGRVIASGTRRLLPASLTYRRRFNDGAWTRRDVNETPTTATSLNGTAAQGSVVVHSASIAMPYHSPNPILTIHHSPLLGKTRSGINAAVNVIEKTASTTSTADASRTAATTTNHQHPPHSERALSLTIRPAFTIAQLETLLRQDLALHESTAGQPAFVVYQNYDSSAGESAGSNTMTSIASDGQPTVTVASSSTTTATEPRSKKASNNIATPADGVDLADRERWSRWSAATTIEEILKDGFRHTGNHDEQRRPIVWAELNGQPMRIVLPSFKERTAEHQQQLELLRTRLMPLERLKKACDKTVESRMHKLEWAGFVAITTQWAVLLRLTFVDYGWDVMEPITFFLLSFNNILAYAFFMVSRRNFSFETLASVTVTKRQMSAYERLGLDIREFDRLRARFEAIEREVETIREEYQ